MPPRDPIDGSEGPRFVLEGDLVTMDAQSSVVAGGHLYVDKGAICAVQTADAPPPGGFETITPIRTGGTIYPGLIELHNHLSYDVLPLWQVPKTYGDRSQWQGTPAYRETISGPMRVLGTLAGYPEAVVRYVECKCLISGVTTSQGIALFSFTGISTYYRGLVRNVERTDDPALPAWKSHIADVAAKQADLFLKSIQHDRYLLHLAEGTDDAAERCFTALEIAPNEWAITRGLTGIHCVPLKPDDFAAVAANGGSMVWSPLSNLLLYGRTADIAAAKTAGVALALGSDWSPSGSKNLFAELKVARIYSRQHGVLSDQELVKMATIDAARILDWDAELGSLEPGKRADLLVVSGTGADPYAHLLDAPEDEIELVVINGCARFGSPELMNALAPAPLEGLEMLSLGAKQRLLDLRQDTEFPKVAALSLAQATERLSQGLAKLPDLKKTLLAKPAGLAMQLTGADPPGFMLRLDHEELPGLALRPHLCDARDFTAAMAATVAPLNATLKPVVLDPICVTNDANYGANLASQINLPDYLKEGLKALY